MTKKLDMILDMFDERTKFTKIIEALAEAADNMVLLECDLHEEYQKLRDIRISIDRIVANKYDNFNEDLQTILEEKK